MSDPTPHDRHSDDAASDDAPPTPAVSDEVSEAAAAAGESDDRLEGTSGTGEAAGAEYEQDSEPQAD